MYFHCNFTVIDSIQPFFRYSIQIICDFDSIHSNAFYPTGFHFLGNVLRLFFRVQAVSDTWATPRKARQYWINIAPQQTSENRYIITPYYIISKPYTTYIKELRKNYKSNTCYFRLLRLKLYIQEVNSTFLKQKNPVKPLLWCINLSTGSKWSVSLNSVSELTNI